MKQKISLITLMLLFALFTLGQNALEKTHSKYRELAIARLSKVYDSIDMDYNHEWAIQRNRQNMQGVLLKSTQNTKQKLDSMINVIWDSSSNKWHGSEKMELIYDAYGKCPQALYYVWNTSTSNWVADVKEEFIYDATEKVTHIYNFVWNDDSNQWVSSYKSENTYNANGKLTQKFFYKWDVSNSQWLASYKSEFTYDDKDSLAQLLYYYWNKNTSQWLTYYEKRYTYDEYGNKIILNSTYDEIHSKWVLSEKTEYTYDAIGNITQQFYYDFIASPIIWVSSYKVKYTLDLSKSLSDIFVPKWIWFYNLFINKPLEALYEKWNESSSVWVVSDKTIWYYSLQNVTSVENIKSENISLYPNPVSEFLNISFISKTTATIDLFDMQGRLLISKKISNFDHLNVKDLKNGMYMYNLYIDGNKHSGKIIKE